jgi:hypothetical protein
MDSRLKNRFVFGNILVVAAGIYSKVSELWRDTNANFRGVFLQNNLSLPISPKFVRVVFITKV